MHSSVLFGSSCTSAFDSSTTHSICADDSLCSGVVGCVIFPSVFDGTLCSIVSDGSPTGIVCSSIHKGSGCNTSIFSETTALCSTISVGSQISSIVCSSIVEGSLCNTSKCSETKALQVLRGETPLHA